MRSAWRGPCANGMTPSRMKSCRPMLVAMNSMAQQASPKLNTQSEYRRPQFSTNLIGSPSTPGNPTVHTLAAGGTRPFGSTVRRMERNRVTAGVAANHPATAEVGLDILQAGGSAADAAVAAVLACSATESIYTGLGGAGFATCYDAASGTVTCLDFFCAVPGTDGDAEAEAGPMVPVEVFFGGMPQVYAIGGASVAVPGVPAG